MKIQFHRLNKGRNDLDLQLQSLKLKAENQRKINKKLLDEEKASLARIARIDDAIQQKQLERAQLEKTLKSMSNRLADLNALKEEVLKSLHSNKRALDSILQRIDGEKNKMHKLEEVKQNWEHQHRSSKSKMFTDFQLYKGRGESTKMEFVESKEHLQKEIDSLVRKLRDFQSKHQSMLSVVSNIDEKIATANVECNLKIKFLKETNEALLDESKRIQMIDQGINGQGEHLTDVKATLHKVGRKKLELQEGHDPIKNEYADLKQHIDFLTTKKTTAEKALDAAKTKLFDTIKLCDQLKQKVAEKSDSNIVDSNKKIRAEILLAKSESEFIGERLKDLTLNDGGLSKHQSLIRSLRLKLLNISLSPNGDSVRVPSLVSLQNDIESLLEEVTTGKTDESNTRQEIEHSIEEEKNLKAEIRNFEMLLAKKKSDASHYETENVEKVEFKVALEGLKKQCHYMQENIDLKQKELDAFDNDASKSLNELKDGNRSQVTNLESKIADTEKACEKYKIIHDNLEKEVLKLESDIKILSSQPAAKPAKPTLPAAGTGGRPKRYLVSPPENPSPRSTVSAPARSLNPSTPSSLTGSALRRRRKSFLDSDSDDDLFPK